MSELVVIVTERPGIPGSYEARLDGQKHVLCTSRQPFTEAARSLARIAISDPEAMIEMRHVGSDVPALRGKLRLVAAMSVVERDRRTLYFEKWRPSQTAVGLDQHEG